MLVVVFLVLVVVVVVFVCDRQNIVCVCFSWFIMVLLWSWAGRLLSFDRANLLSALQNNIVESINMLSQSPNRLRDSKCCRKNSGRFGENLCLLSHTDCQNEEVELRSILLFCFWSSSLHVYPATAPFLFLGFCWVPGEGTH